MKLAILGGGGFRVPLVYRAVLDAALRPGITSVVLHDVAEDRLGAIGRVLEQLPAEPGRAPLVEQTTDLDRALDGADFVFSAVRVGGLAGRVADERVALELGLLGQETTGPGGVAYGLRTVPLAMAIAERVRRRCPAAWVVNFTNPAGMITEAMQAVLGERAIGICDSPMGLARRAARALQVPGATVVDYAGLNHLGWLQGLSVDGRDLLPELLADPQALLSTEEGQLFGVDWVQSIGAIPNEYLYYYYFTREAIAAVRASGQTRGEYLLMQQEEFYRAVAQRPQQALRCWDEVRMERNASYMRDVRGDADRDHQDVADGGYEGVAAALMAALSGGPPASLILNVRNGTTLPCVAPEAVIEVPCAVDHNGPRPLPVSPLTGAKLGLVQQVKAVEQLTIEASVRRSPSAAVAAFAVHPLVDSVAVARQLFDEYRRRIPELAEVFG